MSGSTGSSIGQSFDAFGKPLAFLASAAAAQGAMSGTLLQRNPDFTRSVHSPLDEKENTEAGKKGATVRQSVSDKNKNMRLLIISIIISGSIFIVLLAWFDVFRTFYDSTFFREEGSERRYSRAWAQLSYTIVISLATTFLVFVLHNISLALS